MTLNAGSKFRYEESPVYSLRRRDQARPYGLGSKLSELHPVWMVGNPKRIIDKTLWLMRHPVWMVGNPKRIIDKTLWLTPHPVWMVGNPKRMVGKTLWTTPHPVWMVA
jgi:hypothetical protein